MKEFLKCYQCADASDDRWALLLGTRSPDGRKGTDLLVNPAMTPTGTCAATQGWDCQADAGLA